MFVLVGVPSMALLGVLSGYKTYVAAAGLIGLAVYQLSNGEATNAINSLLAALTAAGLRHAIQKAN